MIKDVIANIVRNLEFPESQTSEPHGLRLRLPRCPFLDSFRLADQLLTIHPEQSDALTF
jgi:hypothetical protein